jgi:hypothetical protein
MTYESQNVVQSVDFTFVVIRQDETSRRKLAVLAAC